MEAGPRVVNFGLEALDGVDLSEEFHRRPHVEVCEWNEGCIQGRNASWFRRDHRREAPTKRGAGGTRLGVVLPHSQVAVFPASARRCRPQKQIGKQVEPVCIRRVVVPFGRKQQVVKTMHRSGRGEEVRPLTRPERFAQNSWLHLASCPPQGAPSKGPWLPQARWPRWQSRVDQSSASTTTTKRSRPTRDFGIGT